MSFTRPSVFPVWADQDVIDPVSGQNNVLTPPPEKQEFGWDRVEFPPRNFFNWLGRYTNRWLQYLAQQESQAIVITDNTGATPAFNVVTGGLATIYVVDTNPSNSTLFYEGIVYIPPGYSSGTLSFNTVNSATLTVSAIAANGGVVVSGGSGTYIIYGQMKTAT